MSWLVLWALFALIPAAIASTKGRSPVGWFFIGVLLSPILAAVIVAVLPSPALEQQRHAELVAAASSAARPVGPDAREDPIDTVARLARLRDSGAITPEEFEAKKAELLSRI
jgi:hypothetical protein